MFQVKFAWFFSTIVWPLIRFYQLKSGSMKGKVAPELEFVAPEEWCPTDCRSSEDTGYVRANSS
jgi:hypothetical protein